MHQLGSADPASTPILRPGLAQAVHGRAHSAHWRRVAVGPSAVLQASMVVSPLTRTRAPVPAAPAARPARPSAISAPSASVRLQSAPRVRPPAERLPVPGASALRPLAQRPRAPSACCAQLPSPSVAIQYFLYCDTIFSA